MLKITPERVKLVLIKREIKWQLNCAKREQRCKDMYCYVLIEAQGPKHLVVGLQLCWVQSKIFSRGIETRRKKLNFFFVEYLTIL